MKHQVLRAITLLSIAPGGLWSQALAEPAATNVRSFQQAGTKLVHIDYDLSGTRFPSWVSVEGSSDGGATWMLPMNSLSGKVGAGITVGSNLRITWDAGMDWNGQVSDLVRFRVTARDAPQPGQMVWIPGGSFEMGDKVGTVVGGDGDSDELPVHTAKVSGFLMQSTEVSNDQMVRVLNWAYSTEKLIVTESTVKNSFGDQQELLDLDYSLCRVLWNPTGRTFEIKEPKGGGYPCGEVTWYGAVAYCNYLSEMEGRAPCYRLEDWSCDFLANGYRLPTEAEWEKAARGGRVANRFPWGNTITHELSNYYSDYRYSYDLSETQGFHSIWGDGEYPLTAPVDIFTATGEGLFQLAGNVSEWCNDWWSRDYYGTLDASLPNPKGPANGERRVHRGGGFDYYARWCRVSYRSWAVPHYSEEDIGFRPVRR